MMRPADTRLGTLIFTGSSSRRLPGPVRSDQPVTLYAVHSGASSARVVIGAESTLVALGRTGDGLSWFAQAASRNGTTTIRESTPSGAAVVSATLDDGTVTLKRLGGDIVTGSVIGPGTQSDWVTVQTGVVWAEIWLGVHPVEIREATMRRLGSRL